MTAAEIKKREKLLAAAILKGVAAGVRDLCAELVRDQTELRAELEQLRKAQGQLRYLGAFEQQRQYSVGSFVTHKGAIWHCNKDGQGVLPGDGSGAWTLACKSGRES